MTYVGSQLVLLMYVLVVVPLRSLQKLFVMFQQPVQPDRHSDRHIEMPRYPQVEERIDACFRR